MQRSKRPAMFLIFRCADTRDSLTQVFSFTPISPSNDLVPLAELRTDLGALDNYVAVRGSYISFQGSDARDAIVLWNWRSHRFGVWRHPEDVERVSPSASTHSDNCNLICLPA